MYNVGHFGLWKNLIAVYCGALPYDHPINTATSLLQRLPLYSGLKKAQSFSYLKNAFNMARFLWSIGDRLNSIPLYFKIQLVYLWYTLMKSCLENLWLKVNFGWFPCPFLKCAVMYTAAEFLHVN